MAEFDKIFRNARVVSSASDEIRDIGIRNGQIAAIGNLGSAIGTVIDCTGKIITPGGVDVHAHIEQVSGMGLMNADTFSSATRSAAIGGTTTVVSFAPQIQGKGLSASMETYQVRAEVGAIIDHAFHIIISDFSVENAETDLRRLIRAGHRSIKLFTTYNIRLDDGAICEVLSIAREEGALVCVHAENDGLIGWTKNKLIAGGLTRPEHHAISHPRLAEVEAVNRLISFAEFFATPVMLFHISTKEAVAAIRAAQSRKVPVWAETCPHYLMMDESVLMRDGLEGAKWMCSPPQRAERDQEALWQGLSDGTLSIVSSDHAPFRFDNTGKLSAGPSPIFSQIANGLPGVEVRMPLMFNACFYENRVSPCEFVRLTATTPAEIYGLDGKGDIRQGFDADLVVWDPDQTRTYEADDLHDNVGYNPWVGYTVHGVPLQVFQRGKPLFGDNEFTPAVGKWLPRTAIGLRSEIEPAREYQAVERLPT